MPRELCCDAHGPTVVACTAAVKIPAAARFAQQTGRVAAVRTALRTPAINGVAMSVYKVIDIIGTSTTSWEDAALAAITTARETLRDLRVAEVVAQDLDLAEGETTFRTKLRVSFKYEADT